LNESPEINFRAESASRLKPGSSRSALQRTSAISLGFEPQAKGRKENSMLNSYEAVYHHGILQWIHDVPDGDNLRVIVTVLERENTRDVSEESIEQLLQRTKGIVRPAKSRDEIDKDIATMRAEWERGWE